MCRVFRLSFVVDCSLLLVCGELFSVNRVLFVDRCLFSVVYCLLPVVGYWALRVVNCLLLVVVVGCSLFVVGCCGLRLCGSLCVVPCVLLLMRTVC